MHVFTVMVLFRGGIHSDTRTAQSHVQLVLAPAPNTQGFRELLKYAGFAWAIETDLAPVEDTSSYWKNVAPIWQV